LKRLFCLGYQYTDITEEAFNTDKTVKALIAYMVESGAIDAQGNIDVSRLSGTYNINSKGRLERHEEDTADNRDGRGDE
jgi:hypothetical protein